jgi:hypothetical protein
LKNFLQSVLRCRCAVLLVPVLMPALAMPNCGVGDVCLTIQKCPLDSIALYAEGLYLCLRISWFHLRIGIKSTSFSSSEKCCTGLHALP